MYAIVKTDGTQLKLEEGQELAIDYRDSKKGDTLTFDDVLAVSTDKGLQLGTPLLEGAKVTAEVLGVVQGDKLTVRHFRRRKNSKTKQGHRQLYTQVRISKIDA